MLGSNECTAIKKIALLLKAKSKVKMLLQAKNRLARDWCRVPWKSTHPGLGRGRGRGAAGHGRGGPSVVDVLAPGRTVPVGIRAYREIPLGSPYRECPLREVEWSRSRGFCKKNKMNSKKSSRPWAVSYNVGACKSGNCFTPQFIPHPPPPCVASERSSCACVRRCRPCLPSGIPGARHRTCHPRRRLQTGRCRPARKKRRQEVKENRRCDKTNKG